MTETMFSLSKVTEKLGNPCFNPCIIMLTGVSAVQQNQGSGGSLQETTETLQCLCCCQVDLIQ